MPIKTGWERLYLEHLKDAGLPEPHPVTPEPPLPWPIRIDWGGNAWALLSVVGGILISLAVEQALQALGYIDLAGCLAMIVVVIAFVVSIKIVNQRQTRRAAANAARSEVHNAWVHQEVLTYVNSLTPAQRQVYESVDNAGKERWEELKRSGLVPPPSLVLEQERAAKVRERYYQQNPWARERDNLL